jgi:hypothetical protein
LKLLIKVFVNANIKNIRKSTNKVDITTIFFEIIYDQLPLAVPCYDLVPVIEFTLGNDKHLLWVLPTPLT